MDYRFSQEMFERYLDHYDRKNEKTELKIIHTYGVVSQSGEIARRMGLSNQDRELARIIALLHDIGRFEQVRRYDSFMPETMDHASYGVQILFGEPDGSSSGIIRQFIREDTWDDIIRMAILKHSDFLLEGITDKRTLLHARIIRDADKLDNCRVKLQDNFETFMGATVRETEASSITDKVRRDALSGRSIRSGDRVTPMDFWVSYIAYFYDLNFRESLDIVQEKHYIEKLIHRICYTDPDTKETMEQLEKRLLHFVRHAQGLSAEKRVAPSL